MNGSWRLLVDERGSEAEAGHDESSQYHAADMFGKVYKTRARRDRAGEGYQGKVDSHVDRGGVP